MKTAIKNKNYVKRIKEKIVMVNAYLINDSENGREGSINYKKK